VIAFTTHSGFGFDRARRFEEITCDLVAGAVCAS